MPTRLGKYVLRRSLGAGAMGEVWEALDTVLERLVALKLLTEAGGDEEEHVREAAAAARVNHPNAVAVYDAASVEGRWYIAMELVPGPNAGQVVVDRGRLPWAEATRIARDAAAGLGAVHAAGLVHRDVKPGNILIAPDGTAKVADFGLAKRTTRSGLTTVTGVVGTPHYMSPEQCWSELADARADVYSLGATYYTLLTGRPPYDGDSEMAVMYAHCNSPVPDPQAVATDAPIGCSAVVRRAMAKTPAERYASAEEMRAALDEVLSGNDPGEAEGATQFRLPPKTIVSNPHRRPLATRRAALAVAVIVGAVAVAFAVLTLWPKNPNTATTPSTRPGDDGADWVSPWNLGGAVQQLAISPDGRHVGVTVIRDGGVEEVHLRTRDGRPVAGWPKLGPAAEGIAFSPDGASLATTSRYQQKIQVLDVASGREIPVREGAANWCPSAVGFSSDGDWMAVGGFTSESAQVRFWQRDGDRGWVKRHERPIAEFAPWWLTFAPRGHLVAVTAFGGPTDPKQVALHLLDATTGKEVPGPQVVLVRDSVGPTVAFATSGAWMAASSFGEIRRFRVPDWQPVGEPLVLELNNDEKKELGVMAISPDEKWVAGGRDRDLHLWRIEDGKRFDFRDVHTDTLHTLAFTPNSRRLLSGGKDGKVIVHDLTDVLR
jgi:Protein kinase domain/WD domain, G-beta repeat